MKKQEARPHKPEQKSLSSVAADGELWSDAREMPAAKYFDGPIQWRDRIREIDAASKEEEARHCDAMASYDEERASLVAKLKAEGFALIQGDEPNSAADSAQQDIAQQDMSDWRKWKEGDILLCVKADCYPSELTVGKLYQYHGDGDVIDDGGAEQGYPVRFGECFKWHSRPPQ